MEQGKRTPPILCLATSFCRLYARQHRSLNSCIGGPLSSLHKLLRRSKAGYCKVTANNELEQDIATVSGDYVQGQNDTKLGSGQFSDKASAAHLQIPLTLKGKHANNETHAVCRRH